MIFKNMNFVNLYIFQDMQVNQFQ